MRISGKKLLTGLDIRTKTIAACELLQKKEKLFLKQVAICDNIAEFTKEGIIVNGKNMSDKIANFFSANNLGGKNIVFCINGSMASVKKIFVKKNTDTDFTKNVYSEAQQHIPFDMNNLYSDFFVLKKTRENELYEVMFVAMKKDIIDSYIAIINNAGLKPTAIDIDSFALQNIYELNYGISDYIVAIINVVFDNTLLIVVKGDYPLYSTEIRINEDSDISELKKKIEKAFEIFYYRHPEEPVEKIFISANEAYTIEITKIAEDIIGPEKTFSMNPFSMVNIDAGNLDISYLKQIEAHATIPIGLAIRASCNIMESND